MNTFGEFLYALRKEKGMTQAELAKALGVTNKAVSKWETGEAMPETALLLPISRIFGVTVDELLAGKRAESEEAVDGVFCGDNAEKTEEGDLDGINNNIFTRRKDEEPKTREEKICGVVCAVVMFAGLTAYLLLGALASLWHPFWVIMPVCALSCGVIGVIFDTCNPAKREKKMKKGENPYTACACAIVMLTCIMAFLLASVFTGLWHPLWIIAAGGAVICIVVGAVGDLISRRKK